MIRADAWAWEPQQHGTSGVSGARPLPSPGSGHLRPRMRWIGRDMPALTTVRRTAGGTLVKRCPRCDVSLPLSDFYADPTKTCGRTSHCKRCRTAYSRSHRREASASQLAHKQEYRRAHLPAKRLYDLAYRRSPGGKAKGAVRNALLRGAFGKPKMCSECGKAAPSRDLHGHHDDYGKPLDIRWLCRRCHGFVHRKYEGPAQSAAAAFPRQRVEGRPTHSERGA